MLTKGTYTAICPACGSSTLIHLLFDGSISPSKCVGCEVGFGGIEAGEERNSFVFVGIVEEEEKIEEGTKKTDKKSSGKKEGTKKTDKKSSGNQSFTLKTSKKSSEKKEETKKTGKKSFKW